MDLPIEMIDKISDELILNDYLNLVESGLTTFDILNLRNIVKNIE